MRPAFHHDLANARVAGLHQHAAREQAAKAAIRARRAQPHHHAHSVPGLTVTGLARRVRTPASGRRSSPA